MFKEILDDAQQRMQKSVQSCEEHLAKIRTGRAQPSLVEELLVDYYGAQTPLKQLANITAEDAQTLAIQAYDVSAVSSVDKALRASDLGLNPVMHGNLLRVPLPPLTEERRKEYVKLAKLEAENGKIAVRNVRRDVNADVKTYVKDKELSEDEGRRLEDKIQELTNTSINRIDVVVATKEKELLSL